MLFAQEAVLSGRVHDQNENLPAATVSVGGKSLSTDHSGRFSISLPQGSYTLTITHIGYKSIKQKVDVENGKLYQLDLVMTPDEAVGEMVFLGSRAASQRSKMNTPVPVDVFTASQLRNTGQISLTQMLNVAAPSFNASRETLNEPATLRGLDPQHVLILLNGVRYHSMAFVFGGNLKGQLGSRGSVANDLNSIPSSAIERVEVLRDGAAAQYGSDAIAGVINIRLKESTGISSAQVHSGQYYQRDGEKLAIEINQGITLTTKGFLNISADYQHQNPTYRYGEYNGTVYKNFPLNVNREDSIRIKAEDDSIILARGFKKKSVIDNVGNVKTTRAGVAVNSGYSIGDRTELLLTAAFNQRKVERESVYRFPKNSGFVNIQLYPDGFQAVTYPTTTDASAMIRLNGKMRKDWRWNVSTSLGANTISSAVKNSNNASQFFLGKNAQTDFFTGKQMYSLWTANINLIKSNIPDKHKPFNFAAGVEGRLENYRTTAGEEASWRNYDPTGSTQPGSQGSTGRSPENAVHGIRHVIAGYLDGEKEFGQKFLLGTAARFEYYSDFGPNVAGKLTARYKLTEEVMLRMSVNNGFRAPGLQQQYGYSYNNVLVRTGAVVMPATRGTFPNDHAAVRALGVAPLSAEKSVNISTGITARAFKRVRVTVDGYWIQIKDRIVQSGIYNRRTNRSVDSILSLYPNLNVLDQITFFANAVNTRTYGSELVANCDWAVGKSQFVLNLAANFARTHLFGIIPSATNLPKDDVNTNALFSREQIGSMEKGQPSSKISLRLSFQRGVFSLDINNTRFGSTSTLDAVDSNLDEFFSAKVITDFACHFAPSTSFNLTIGVNNIFNVYPDKLKHSENSNQGIFIYSPDASPFAFNGGYYYTSLAFSVTHAKIGKQILPSKD